MEQFQKSALRKQKEIIMGKGIKQMTTNEGFQWYHYPNRSKKKMSNIIFTHAQNICMYLVMWMIDLTTQLGNT